MCSVGYVCRCSMRFSMCKCTLIVAAPLNCKNSKVEDEQLAKNHTTVGEYEAVAIRCTLLCQEYVHV